MRPEFDHNPETQHFGRFYAYTGLIVCRQSFVQMELKPAALAGSELLEEPGDLRVEVEIAVVFMEKDAHVEVLLRGDHEAPFVSPGKTRRARPASLQRP